MNILALFISAMLINNIVLTKFLGMCPFMGVSTPLNLEYMQLITFILLIAAFVQFVELFVKKFSPALYKQLGIYLPLITTNCTVLYVAQDNITKGYTLVETMVNSIATPAGFMLMLVIFATIRERLNQNNVPKSFQGNPIAFVVAGIMAIAFSALAGLV